jgi:hypothetical protein
MNSFEARDNEQAGLRHRSCAERYLYAKETCHQVGSAHRKGQQRGGRGLPFVSLPARAVASLTAAPNSFGGSSGRVHRRARRVGSAGPPRQNGGSDAACRGLCSRGDGRGLRDTAVGRIRNPQGPYWSWSASGPPLWRD